MMDENLDITPGILRKKSLADEALESANILALKQLFDESCHDLETLVAGFSVMLNSRQAGPLPSDCGITAIRDVALASIDLARLVVSKGGEE